MGILHLQSCSPIFPWLANLLGSGCHLFILATLGRGRGFDCMQEVCRMSGIARIGHLSPAREHFPCNSPRLCQTCGREARRGTAGMQYRARWLLSGWAAAAACMCRGKIAVSDEGRNCLPARPTRRRPSSPSRSFSRLRAKMNMIHLSSGRRRRNTFKCVDPSDQYLPPPNEWCTLKYHK